MVDMNMGQNKSLNIIDWKFDFEIIALLGVLPLKGPTIDKQRARGVQLGSMTGSSDSGVATMMRNFHGRLRPLFDLVWERMMRSPNYSPVSFGGRPNLKDSDLAGGLAIDRRTELTQSDWRADRWERNSDPAYKTH
jgi:hypothetical protein